MSGAPTRPVLRYHGGKWKLAPWIISHFPAHRVYVEPFGGGASVLLRKPRSYAEVYNDIDGDIVNVFRVLRDPASAAALKRALELTPFARDEFEAAYEPASDPVEQARRTIVRAFMGYGSNGASSDWRTGFRSNTKRSGTTPAHDWAGYPAQVPAFCERLRGVVIEHRHYAQVVQDHDSPETLFYCDPPYPHETRGEHRYRNEMLDADHAGLAHTLRAARGMVIVSGYRCPLYENLYGDWERVDTQTHADGALDRVESLWLSPRAQFASRRLF